ncbi:MAG TPA: hypothetical protein PLW86_13535 [Rhodocyclaceae bacterium]|nr:hypothetical protein [Rhodocyclaceae bacterium]
MENLSSLWGQLAKNPAVDNLSGNYPQAIQALSKTRNLFSSNCF